ncbi:MAG: alanine--tRNA ligase [Candidatus Saccharibacteria bacterium]|nr:alanine--tRNA ligase [Candidatus Saccharibacteria bacterium]
MNAQQIRQKYLEFFAARGHQILRRAPLILQNDPTTLFTGAGMQPLLPYLLGQPHPAGCRLADSQTCLRSQDIEDVGDNRHTTFFEMLGNWSLGDYFKEQQIRWFFEFLTKEVGLDPHKIYVTCFIGDTEHDIPRDDEAAAVWQKVFAEVGIDAKIVELGTVENGDKLGMQGGRIFFYDDNENWWSRGGGLARTPIGDPCGPDSEVFYDFGEENHDPSYGQAHPASDSGRFMEIGNQVFMEYRRMEDGGFKTLEKKNVDFGAGLERIAAAQLGSADVFKNSLLWPIVEALEHISGKAYTEHTASMRVIADHLRSAVFLAVDGCKPSNKEHGYVMRRLLRRALVKAFDLGIEQNFLQQIIPVVIEIYANDYPETSQAQDEILVILTKEEKAFRQTLRKGLRQLERLKDLKLSGEEIFMLHDTFGFPAELSLEEAKRQGIEVDKNWRQSFDAKMLEQRQRSQTASKGMFKGGLEGKTDAQTRLHTSAHLLLAALKQVLGSKVEQKGSNITDERLRFDFNYDQKMMPEQIAEVERLVNQAISAKLPVSWREMTLDEAKQAGAHGSFEDRYGDRVKVYQIGEAEQCFSHEICGGPHVQNTAEIAPNGEKFVITKEQSSAAGIRRIKAILRA